MHSLMLDDIDVAADVVIDETDVDENGYDEGVIVDDEKKHIRILML